MKKYIIEENIEQGLQAILEHTQMVLAKPAVENEYDDVPITPVGRSLFNDILLSMFLFSFAVLIYCFITNDSIFTVFKYMVLPFIFLLATSLFIVRDLYKIDAQEDIEYKDFTRSFE